MVPSEEAQEPTIDLQKLRQVWFHERGDYVYSGFVLWETTHSCVIVRCSDKVSVLNRSANAQSYEKNYNQMFDTEEQAKMHLVQYHNENMKRSMDCINRLLAHKKVA